MTAAGGMREAKRRLAELGEAMHRYEAETERMLAAEGIDGERDWTFNETPLFQAIEFCVGRRWADAMGYSFMDAPKVKMNASIYLFEVLNEAGRPKGYTIEDGLLPFKGWILLDAIALSYLANALGGRRLRDVVDSFLGEAMKWENRWVMPAEGLRAAAQELRELAYEAFLSEPSEPDKREQDTAQKWLRRAMLLCAVQAAGRLTSFTDSLPRLIELMKQGITTITPEILEAFSTGRDKHGNDTDGAGGNAPQSVSDGEESGAADRPRNE